MRWSPATLIGVVLAVAVLATACTGGGEDLATPTEPRETTTAEEEQQATVQAPSDITARGVPGRSRRTPAPNFGWHLRPQCADGPCAPARP